MITMNEQDKNDMLDMINDEKETYEAKLWGALMACNSELIKNSLILYLIGDSFTMGAGMAGGSGAFSNRYCYLGLTGSGLNFVVLNSIDVKKIEIAFKIPYELIKKVKIKSSVIPGRKVIQIFTEIGMLKLSLMNNAIASDIQGQKEAVQYLCSYLESRF